MNWFSFGRKTKDNLQSIESLSIQNRVDGGRETKPIVQYAQTINNFFGTPKTTEPIQLEESYYGEYGLDEDDITNMTQEDWEKYGSYDNWVEGIVSEDFFKSTPKLVAEYGTIKNYKKGITIEEKARGGFFGLSYSVAKEVELANNAKAIIREEDERTRTKQAEQFKRKTEQQIRAEAERIEKATESATIAKTMVDMVKKEREDNAKVYKEQSNNLIEQMKVLAGLVSSINPPKQLSEKVVVDELMSRFNRPQNDYIDAKVLAR